MTRIALISDIHANLPALEAVLTDIARQSVDGIYHIGDLVGYAPWPDEVVALIREKGIAGVAGNYDSTVGLDYKHCGCRYEDPRQEALSHESFEWTKASVSADTKRWLATLPFRLDVRPGGGHGSRPNLILVHGTPVLNTVYWTEDRPDEFCSKMAALAGARPGDLIAFGHTHKPWRRTVGGIGFVNTGSVGRPKDGDPRAGHVVLEVPADGSTGSTWGIEIRRVEYDVERAANAIIASTLPNELANYLRSGGASLDAQTGSSR